MNKETFLKELQQGLAGLPQNDIEERLSFYREMMEDRMEEGLTEEEAVKEIGSVEEILGQILAETPLTRLVKEKIRPKKRMKTWEIILLALGSPIWLTLLIALFAVVLSLYIVLWALVICVWAIGAAFLGCFAGCIAAGIALLPNGRLIEGFALIAIGLVFGGLTLLMYLACKAATRGTAKLTKKIALGIKKCFVKKEKTQ